MSASMNAATALAEPTAPVAEGEAAAKIEGKSPWRLGIERLRRDRAAMISLGIIVAIVLIAIFAPVIAAIVGHGPNQQFTAPIGQTAEGQPVGPSTTFWMGTDTVGRDVLVRIAYGARISLIVGLVATVLTVTIGAIVGLASAYFGGLTDSVLARVMDWLLAVPFLLLAISLVSVIGPGLTVLIIVIGFLGWASVGRIVRGQVLSIREKEYVEAARSLGAGPWRIMFIDILPNVIAPIIVYTSLLIPVTIVAEASLSFLGVGIPPPTADWGQMIADSQSVYQYGAWWYLVFPSLALLITTLAFNIFGDGVRDAFDPRGDQLFV
ncbi:MAG TPA: ABC transporter permease [Arthrobacter sp.]|jgi:ABC-type dipeptide/oligopeptide/nickel transport system permease subunit|nr:ABC transporter permease [Arthrobacter sp.]